MIGQAHTILTIYPVLTINLMLTIYLVLTNRAAICKNVQVSTFFRSEILITTYFLH